jgi:hypothetical protein
MAFNGAGGVRDERNPLRSGVSRVAFTVAAEASNVIKVTASLKRGLRPNAAPARRQLVRAYLTQNPTTLAVAGTAPATSVAVSAKGSIVATITSKLVWLIVADANGEFDLNIANGLIPNSPHEPKKSFEIKIIIKSITASIMNVLHSTFLRYASKAGPVIAGTAAAEPVGANA